METTCGSLVALSLQSPWGSVGPAAPACSLTEVMSEQLARQLDEENAFPALSDPAVEPLRSEEAPDTASDLMLAQMLQMQFDREFDDQLRREEKNLEEQPVPEEVVLKVFKTTLNEFKNRDRYIKDDYRFKDRFSKLNPRKVIRLWAEKEMHNLSRMKKAGIPCPDVVLLKKHILVMSFIGKEHVPAPKLKDVTLGSEEMKEAYQQVLQVGAQTGSS
ncbi:hypothetical protein XENOCAPTIV_004640 [Xenoophorus captivus]|uniref:non-specific serine/threonine protein kinase n=1 Tax=Xenoophorus captivus TaxID=1517983 RepID=A0ABV0QGH4_9TELE